MTPRKKLGMAFSASVVVLPVPLISRRMRRMMQRALVIAVVVSGCRPFDSAAPAVVLPPATEIDAIEVTPNFGDTRTSHRITDQRRIRQFAEYINERSDGWLRPSDTF